MVAEKAEGALSLVARLFGGVGGLSSSPIGKGDLVACMHENKYLYKMLKCIPELIWSLLKSLVSNGY